METKNWKFKTGLGLIVLSILLFAFLLIIPFLETTDKNKIFILTITFVLAEVLFWSGGLLLGKQVFDKYKNYFNPKSWFVKKNRNGT